MKRWVSRHKKWLAVGLLTAGLGLSAAPLLADDHGKEQHGASSHGGHDASINWVYGLIGEKADLHEPNLIWRTKGMPVPLLANVINFAIFVGGLSYFGKKKLTDGLLERRNDIMQEVDEASGKEKAARKRYNEYKSKLDKISAEGERIKNEYKDQGEHDRKRILKEAEERQERMLREAKHLLVLERKAAHEALLEQTIAKASDLAEEIVKKQVGQADHQRWSEEFLTILTSESNEASAQAKG
jgi:F-type H+-transporting ATPase subunit b